MNLLKYCRKHGIDAGDILLYTIGTDGLKLKDSSIFSLSFADVTSDIFTTVYMHGATPWTIYEYTGVSREYYMENARGIEEVAGLLEDINPGLRITYNTEFSEPFLQKQFTSCSLMDVPLLDINEYAVLVRQRETIPMDLPPKQLYSRTKEFAAPFRMTFNQLRNAYRIPEDIPDCHKAENITEQKIRELKFLTEKLI